ncbi:alpha/beta hydrolase [Aliiroseovarius sp. PTFE2010]
MAPSPSGLTRRALLGGLGGSLLASCTPRGLLVATPDLGNGMTQTLWAVSVEPSARALVAPDYRDRFESISSFARYEVAIPPSHRVGQVEWPTVKGDPGTSFGIADLVNLEAEERMFEEIAARLGPEDEIGVFVHGYNNSYSEALYRHAQIAFDYGLASPQITYVWPSDGKPLGYVADRDNVLISRDGLLRFLDRLSTRFPNRVLVAAHSMGALLVMEVMRQAALTGNTLAQRLAGMVLISPDIGMDVFLSQIAPRGTLPSETIIVVSQKDRLLHLSQRLAGGQARLGEGSDIEKLESLDIVVIDLSDAPGGDPRNHLTAMTSPTAISFLQALIDDDTVLSDERRSGLLLLQVTSAL